MSNQSQARAWMRVRADALCRNYQRIVEAVGPETHVLPMVKAEAYGLGAREVVSRLEPLGPWGFGVATVAEGVALRHTGVERPIVVCSPVPSGEIPAAIEADLHLSVSSLKALEEVERAAETQGRVASVHVDVDTGMGRSGFDWRSADAWVPEVAGSSRHRRLAGVYTHLHSADDDRVSVEEQGERFSAVVGRFGDDACPPLVHVLNSAGVFRAPDRGNALVRPGIFLYGGAIGEGQPTPEEVVSVHARVVHVRDAPEGTTLGYGSTYRSMRDERWATLSIGYGDGVPRALGNKGHALVHGVRVPIIGRISMDVTVVDITGVPAVEEGEIATLIGTQGKETITLDDVARLANTISYEILTGLTPRLPRVWSDV